MVHPYPSWRASARRLATAALSIGLLGLAVALGGCASEVVHKPGLARSGTAKVIAIFLDGTHNDIAADTNVKRLHSLVALQDRPDLATLYVEGVGTGDDGAGMALGVGTAERVRLAYRFLLEQYVPGTSKIYLFGFSRGAYEARILASMLYRAGIARPAPGGPAPDTEQIAHAVYDELFEPSRAADPACAGEGLHQPCAHTHLQADEHVVFGAPVPVELLGLWDTVAALGLPDELGRLEHKAHLKTFAVDVNDFRDKYGDQLCNVRRAYHALSLDDDREWIFTPVLLTRKHLVQDCAASSDQELVYDAQHRSIRPERLHEVWFSGAHSDVGGGYQESLLSGVPLNWMIQQMRRDRIDADLLPERARADGTAASEDKPIVPQDVFGTSHDPETGYWHVLYHAMTRNIGAYVTDPTCYRPEDCPNQQLDQYHQRLCVHPSVFTRRAHIAPAANENHQLALDDANERYVCLARDDAEGASSPQRLKQVRDVVCAPAPGAKELTLSCHTQQDRPVPVVCAAALAVEIWPHCNETKVP